MRDHIGMIDAFREMGSSTTVDTEQSVTGNQNAIVGKRVTIDLRTGDQVDNHGWQCDDRRCNTFPYPIYFQLRITQKTTKEDVKTVLWVPA